MAKPKLGPHECGLKQIMWELNLKARSVHDLAEAGIIIRTGHGRFDRVESTRRYVTHLRSRAARDPSIEGGDGLSANASYRAAQTKLLDLRYQKEAGEVIPVAELTSLWTRAVTVTRQLFMRVPARCRFDMPHLTGEDQKEMTRICREMLQEAALYGEVKLPEGAEMPEEEIEEA